MSTPRIDKECLIALVQERPCIWDTRTEAFHVRALRDDAWDEIGEEMFGLHWLRCRSQARLKMLEELQMKWRSVRNTYRKELSNRRPSGSGRRRKRPYYLAPALCFLRPLMEPRLTADNLPEQQSHDEATDTEASSPTISLHSDGLEAPEAPPAPPPPSEETPPPAAPRRTPARA
ncbi:hypothetical protein GDO78_018337 [Eleutherodactylus coqui]|uniref:MADF domain-containing protein n=1 Tax=Eleutherodactylus coqui TaxID=57060 RepID=A0A8J6BLZ5_ELECQ|nr:hypothetical protein GDO78_018337 [Eleutherodactylus coqui]